ncbi:MAG: lysostaphin resistance A-like protein [Christensenellales bacterium]
MEENKNSIINENNNYFTIVNNDKELLKRAYEYRKRGFNYKDSALSFLIGGYFSPLIVVFVLSFLLVIVSTVSGIDYQTLTTTRPFDILILLCAEFGFLAYYLYVQFFSKNKKQFGASVGFTFKKFDVVICLVVVAVAILMSVLTSNFISLVNEGLKSIGYMKDSSLPFAIDSVGNLILGLIVMALIPAICEEFLFRGVMLGGMLNSANTRKAKVICVVLSALFFALVHQSALQLVYPFIMGLVFGFVYLFTNNLLYSIILHFVSNGFVVVMNYIYYVNGVTQETITFDAGFILGAIGLLLIAIMLAVGGIALIKKRSAGKSVFMVDNEKIEAYEKVEALKENNENGVQESMNQQLIDKVIKEKDYTIGKVTFIIGLVFGVGMILVDLLTTILK